MLTTRRVPSTLSVVVAAIATLATVAFGSAADAQTDAAIEVIIDSPPSLAASLDARLVRDGADITDSACGPIDEAGWPESRGISCNGLADGEYSVAVVGAGAATQSWDCVDITASRTDPSSITIGGGFAIWVCSVVVSRPGIVIVPTTSYDADGPVTSYDVEIVDADGDVVSTGCEADTRTGDGTRLWCTPLPEATYTVGALDVPTGLAAPVRCSSDAGRDVTAGTVTVDAVTPVWFCERPTAFRPLIVNFSWDGAQGRDRAWFDALALTLTDTDGNDVSDRCEEVNGNEDDFDLFIEWACTDEMGGGYTVEFEGVPDEFEVENGCAPVVVPTEPLDITFCRYQVVSEPIVVDPPDTTPPGPDPTTELPATGTASTSAAWLAALAVGLGLTLVRASRRRIPGHAPLDGTTRMH